MNGVRSIFSVDLARKTFDPLSPRPARDLKVKEKGIEDWMAGSPGLLFTLGKPTGYSIPMKSTPQVPTRKC